MAVPIFHTAFRGFAVGAVLVLTYTAGCVDRPEVLHVSINNQDRVNSVNGTLEIRYQSHADDFSKNLSFSVPSRVSKEIFSQPVQTLAGNLTVTLQMDGRPEFTQTMPYWGHPHLIINLGERVTIGWGDDY